MNRKISAIPIIDTKVKNSSGENIGEIRELMVNAAKGDIKYAVLSFGEFFGSGEKLFAIPWQYLNISRNEEKFILDVKKEDLEGAPGFDKDECPDISNPKWRRNVDDFWKANCRIYYL